MNYKDIKKYAWATYLYGDDYVLGVAGLYAMLKKVNTKFDLVVIVPKGALSLNGRHMLESLREIIIKDVDNLCFSTNDFRYKTTLNKFHIYNLIEYDKICFLDLDLIFYNNYDYIFLKETPCFYLNEDTGCVSGELFLITPNKTMFEWIINNYQNSDTLTDEKILFDLYYKCKIENQKYSLIEIQQKKDYIHDLGSYKYWFIFEHPSQVIDFIIKNDYKFLDEFLHSEIYDFIKNKVSHKFCDMLSFLRIIQNGYIP